MGMLKVAAAKTPLLTATEETPVSKSSVQAAETDQHTTTTPASTQSGRADDWFDPADGKKGSGVKKADKTEAKAKADNAEPASKTNTAQATTSGISAVSTYKSGSREAKRGKAPNKGTKRSAPPPGNKTTTPPDDSPAQTKATASSQQPKRSSKDKKTAAERRSKEQVALAAVYAQTEATDAMSTSEDADVTSDACIDGQAEVSPVEAARVRAQRDAEAVIAANHKYTQATTEAKVAKAEHQEAAATARNEALARAQASEAEGQEAEQNPEEVKAILRQQAELKQRLLALDNARAQKTEAADQPNQQALKAVAKAKNSAAKFSKLRGDSQSEDGTQLNSNSSAAQEPADKDAIDTDSIEADLKTILLRRQRAEI
uniref:Uncharacterized protein n=1 Tax=Globisporangium ultimum (strain ATCC 200006 / CBS 805.95 / DAOM BR144) TaxID=431595 RepID=K3WLV3_GLOUD